MAWVAHALFITLQRACVAGMVRTCGGGGFNPAISHRVAIDNTWVSQSSLETASKTSSG